jgi:hypothetical protein
MHVFQTTSISLPAEATRGVGIKTAVTITNAVMNSLSTVVSKSTSDVASGLVASTRVLSTGLLQLNATLRVRQEGVGPGSLGRTHENPTRGIERITALLNSSDGQYALQEPIVLEVSDADGDGIYVVSDTFSTIYGAGPSPAEALRDYSSNLFADFEDLQDDEASLGPALREELSSLRRYIATQ